MEEKKIWIRGNRKYPDRVLEALVDLGGVDHYRFKMRGSFKDEGKIFVIENSSIISSLDVNTLVASEAIMKTWKEIYPRPDYKFSIGDEVIHTITQESLIIKEKLIGNDGKPEYECNDGKRYLEEFLMNTDDLSRLVIWEDSHPYWHKYPEDKPKERGRYLVLFKENQMYVGEYSTKTEEFFILEDVKAWMELPKYESII